MSEIIGWVGMKGARTVTGWAADEGNLGEPLTLQVSVGAWTSEPVLADSYRHHLRERGLGTARYGFTVDIPQSVGLPPGQKIAVAVVGHPGARFATRTAETATHPEKAEALEALRIVADGGLPARRNLQSLDDLGEFAEKLLRGRRLADLLRDAGRAYARRGDPEGTLRLLGAAMQLAPDDRKTTLQYAIAASRAQRHDEALACFRRLRPGGWRRAKVLSEHAQALRRIIEQSGHDPDPEQLAELGRVVEDRLADDTVAEGVLPASVAVTLGRLGAFDLALRAVDHTLALRPDRVEALVVKARLLIENKRVADGLEIARSVLRTWPENEAAQYMVRACRDLGDVRPDGDAIAFLEAGPDGAPVLRREDGAPPVPLPSDGALRALVAEGAFDWLSIGGPGPGPGRDRAALGRAVARKAGAGCIRLSGEERLWKAAAVGDALEAGLAALGTLTRDLAKLERFYVRPAPERAPGRALLISRYGALRYGGAEHFLHSAALHYAGMGYRPLLLGDVERRGLGPVPPLEDGLDHDFAEMTPAALRRLVVAHDATLVHALSGMGFLAASALGEMSIPFVYGVHYFREAFGGQGGEVFFAPDGAPIPRADFAYILARASTVYANSTYTRDLIEKAHGLRCSVIHSVPEERPA